MATTSKQRLALAICDFLSSSLEDGTLSSEEKDSIDVAINCIGESFKVDPSDKIAVKSAIGSQNLMQIYGVYEKLKLSGKALGGTADGTYLYGAEPTPQVTEVVTKSNAQRNGMVLWDEVAAEVAKEFPDVTQDKMLVDAMTCRMVLKPESLDTIVATNLHADILSDLAAALAGPSASRRHPTWTQRVRTPVCLSPSTALLSISLEWGVANPVATFWTSAEMLAWLGEKEASQKLLDSVERICEKGIVTADLGGTAKDGRRDEGCH
ncbi:hypothetical protein NUW58_g5650 [Xylaria curta]|uniref:Uncharacterized protein n=1 Tax=Xylaria curta TaxID=42375 RepID=A0ACC1P1R9_9PEZI|nr:hypothetical protein NUW58_g5650 [Xylaria curta]